MKGFFKIVLAVIVAQILLGVLWFLFVMVMVGAMAAMGVNKITEVKPGSVLRINLETPLVEREISKVNPTALLMGGGMPKGGIEIRSAVLAIEAAKNDDRIKGIYIDASDQNSSIQKLEELRGKLLEFKESGKFIYAYSNGLSQTAYFLSSVADSIFMNPVADMEWYGLGATLLYMKRGAEKFGIEPQVIRHGKYKSAVEPYMDDQMSPANREQITSYLGDIWGCMVEEIGKARSLSPETLNAIADTGVYFSASSAKEHNLIDATRYEDEVFASLISREVDTTKGGEPRFVTLREYSETLTPNSKANSKEKTVAIVYADGEIIPGNDTEGKIGGAGYVELLRKVRKDKKVGAVVLRVSSPGGSALASDEMWRELQLIKAEKPLVISMGDYAASGGYYISAPGNYIYANRTTVTGSIGVFSLTFSAKKLLRDKIGFTPQSVKTNKHSAMNPLYEPFDAEEVKIMQRSVEDIYSVFTQHVAEGRGLEQSYVDSIGQGRVWTGTQGVSNKLVDSIGTLEDAIAKAIELAKLDNPRVVSYPEADNSFMAQLQRELSRQLSFVFPSLRVKGLEELEKAAELLEKDGIRAEMLYPVEIR